MLRFKAWVKQTKWKSEVLAQSISGFHTKGNIWKAKQNIFSTRYK